MRRPTLTWVFPVAERCGNRSGGCQKSGLIVRIDSGSSAAGLVSMKGDEVMERGDRSPRLSRPREKDQLVAVGGEFH